MIYSVFSVDQWNLVLFFMELLIFWMKIMLENLGDVLCDDLISQFHGMTNTWSIQKQPALKIKQDPIKNWLYIRKENLY